jgi:hypothetical protein
VAFALYAYGWPVNRSYVSNILDHHLLKDKCLISIPHFCNLILLLWKEDEFMHAMRVKLFKNEYGHVFTMISVSLCLNYSTAFNY